jgi:hypothetical protein
MPASCSKLQFVRAAWRRWHERGRVLSTPGLKLLVLGQDGVYDLIEHVVGGLTEEVRIGKQRLVRFAIEPERPDQGRTDSMPGAAPAQTGSPSPSVEEVADAVVRATTRTAGAFGTGAPAAQTAVTPAASEPRPLDPAQRRTPDYTPPISAAGPLYRVLEGTIIDTVLTNRLDGAMAAPVNCLVTNALYSHTGRQVRRSPVRTDRAEGRPAPFPVTLRSGRRRTVLRGQPR